MSWACSPSTSISAITVPIGTVSPSWTSIFDIVPVAGEGISMLTLSVMTLDQWIVLLDPVARRNEPPAYDSLCDRLAYVWQLYLHVVFPITRQ